MRKKRKNVIALIVVTFNPGNQPFKTWIQEHIEYLHIDHKMKSLFPKNYVVTRQNFYIKKRIMRIRFQEMRAGERNECGPVAGNFKLHNKRCMCCES